MSPVARPETTTDLEAIREVNRLEFDQEDEARLVDALRDGGLARISLVAEEDGQVAAFGPKAGTPASPTAGAGVTSSGRGHIPWASDLA